MSQRHCLFCQKPFQPSRYHPEQTACAEPQCQQQRRSRSRKKKLAEDPEYREVCRDSARKWRANNPGYWKQYRAQNPESTVRNRERQHQRDEHQRVLDLANNHLALDLKPLVANVFVLGPAGVDLANNNLASAKLLILQGPPRKPAKAETSCKQHPSGQASAFCPTTEENLRC
jgi:hypothetical protein